MTFLATRHGTDGDYSEKFNAQSWSEAYEICRKKMWRLDGEYVCSVPVFPTSWFLVRFIVWVMNFFK